jgi:hypothetical protein
MLTVAAALNARSCPGNRDRLWNLSWDWVRTAGQGHTLREDNRSVGPCPSGRSSWSNRTHASLGLGRATVWP